MRYPGDIIRYHNYLFSKQFFEGLIKSVKNQLTDFIFSGFFFRSKYVGPLFFLSHWLAMSNSCCNPFLYAILCVSIRIFWYIPMLHRVNIKTYLNLFWKGNFLRKSDSFQENDKKGKYDQNFSNLLSEEDCSFYKNRSRVFIFSKDLRCLEYTYDRNVSTWPLIFWQQTFCASNYDSIPTMIFVFICLFVKICIPTTLDT